MRFAGSFEKPKRVRPRSEITMYMLIDITNLRVIAQHKYHTALHALHYIQFANVDAVVIGLGVNRTWAQFSPGQLEVLYANGGGNEGDIYADKYTDKIRKVRKLYEDAPYLQLPFSLDDLRAQAEVIDPNDARPMAYNPGGSEPTVLAAWTFPPSQASRARKDSSFALTFAAGNGGAPPPPLAPAKASRAPRTAAPPPPGTTPPAPQPRRSRSAAGAAVARAPREPGAASGRPKPGSTTGKVWDIADKLAADYTGKELRRAVIKECEANGINASTGSVQFGKWAAATGRR